MLVSVEMCADALPYVLTDENNKNGVDIKLTDDVYSVSWKRNVLYNDYHEEHIAKSFETAYKKTPYMPVPTPTLSKLRGKQTVYPLCATIKTFLNFSVF